MWQGWGQSPAGGGAGGATLPRKPGEADFPSGPLCQGVTDTLAGILASRREMSYADEV